MLRTTVASSDTIHVLIALEIITLIMVMTMMMMIATFNLSHLTAVFRKVNACSEHSTNVSMTLIKSFLDDCLEMIDNRLVLVDTPQMLPG